MFKFVKYLAIVIVIAAVILAGVIYTTDVNQYKDEIVQLVKEKTGRDFQIQGDLKLAPSLIPTIAVEGVSFGNPDWASEKNMASISRFEAQIALMPLLKGNVQIVRLVLIEPEIHLETNKEGKGNWVIGAVAAKEEKKAPIDSSTGGLPAMAINEVRIEKANLSYKDGKTGKVTNLLVDSITADANSFSDPMDLSIKAQLNDESIEVQATLGAIKDLLADKDFPVKLDANVAKAKLAVDGKLTKPMQAKGMDLTFNFDVDSLSRLNKVAGTELPEAGPIKVGGKLSDTDKGYSVKSLTAQLLQYDITGDLAIDFSGERPAITANLSSEKLDLSPLQADEKEETEKKDKVFSSEPFPLEGLKAADVDLTFNTKQLITKDLTFDNVKVAINLKNGVLQIAPLQTMVANGSLSTTIKLDASKDIPTLTADVKANKIELGQFPHLKGKMSGALTDLKMNIMGSGKSMAEVMAGLNGNILIQAGEGTFTSKEVDLVATSVLLKTFRMFTPEAKGNIGTKLECLVLNVDIKDGLAILDEGIGMRTAPLDVLGGGTINLKTEELNLGAQPKSREVIGLNLGSLAGLVRVGGTLANPSYRTDTRGALSAGVSAGAAFMTGGLSLLGEGLWAKTRSTPNPCDVALGKASIGEPASNTAAESEPKKSVVGSSVDTAKDAVGGAADAVKGTFKKLFGK